jgi:inosine/xanthosine triphosphatase
MRVVVGSQNPVKRDAAYQAFCQYFVDVKIISVRVDSGVKPFPMSQTETVQGAINRARHAQQKEPSADFAVGIEGGLVTFNNATYIQAIAAVLKKMEISVARSVAIEVSQKLVDRLDPTSDASKVTVDRWMGRNNLFQNEGVMGVLTQNRLTRTQVLCDTVVCALPRFLLPEFYPDKQSVTP